MEMISRVARALLEEEPLWIYDPENRLQGFLADEASIDWLTQAPAFSASPYAVTGGEILQGPLPRDLLVESGEEEKGAKTVGVWVSETLAPPSLKCLVLRPRNLVVGIGCNRGTSAEEILGFLREMFVRENLSPLSIRNLTSVDLKSDEAGILEAAAALGCPVYFYPREAIENITVPNPSSQVARHIGVQSVCEATALLSARSQILIVSKRKTPNVTLAVARVDSPS
jgi:cobalt-precorrin 5A hydrolase